MAPSSSRALIVQAPRQPSAPVTRTRSGKRRVLVDRYGLRVELDRRAPLLVRAPAGALDAAEGHVHVRAGGLRVDVDDPRANLARKALHRMEIAGEDRGREAEAHRVRPRDGLVERGEVVERGHGAEHLLAGELRVVAEPLEYGRGDEVSLVGGPGAAREDGPAVRARTLDCREDVLQRALVDDGTDLDLGVGGVAHLPGGDARQKPVAKLAVH